MNFSKSFIKRAEYVSGYLEKQAVNPAYIKKSPPALISHLCRTDKKFCKAYMWDKQGSRYKPEIMSFGDACDLIGFTRHENKTGMCKLKR